jgi:membrane protease YdiL (CAAX protease family)
MITSNMPSCFVWGLLLIIWAIFSIYLARKSKWFSARVTVDEFPFTARQFFVIGASLVFSIGVYLVAFKLARGLTIALQQTPLSRSFELYTVTDWTVLEHICALVFSLIGLSLLISLLPVDLLPIVMGKNRNWKKWCNGAVIGFFVFPVVMLVTNIIAMIIAKVAPHARVDQEALALLSRVDRGFLFLFLIGTIVFVVPFVEEFLFRGFLQGFLGGIVHPVLAIVGTSVAFAMFHYSSAQMASNIEIISGLFVYSLLASSLRAKKSSVMAAVGMHTAFNALALLSFFILRG